MRGLITTLGGIALFLFGLMTMESAVYWIVDTNDLAIGFLLMATGALMLSTEMSRW